MKKLKIITILALSIFLFSCTINAEEKQETTTTLNKDVEIEVLKERINGNEEKRNIQLDALKEKINNQQKVLKDEIALRSETLEKLMNLYAAIAIVIVAIISFLGYKTITNWIKGTIEDKTDTEIKKHVTTKYIEEIVSKNITPELISGIVIKNAKDAIADAINKTVSELDTKAKEKLSELDDRFAILENLQNDYENVIINLKSEVIDISKPTEETSKNLKLFEEKVAQVKTEDGYSITDWFYKGISELGNKKYSEAITSLKKAIELEPKDSIEYSNRALSYMFLNQFESSFDDINKAIKMEPTGYMFNYIRGTVYIGLKQYENALADLNLIIEKTPPDLQSLRPIIYYLRGMVYVALKDYKSALEDYKEGINIELPTPTDGYTHLSALHIIMGDYKGALDSITKALPPQDSIEGKVIRLYLECVAKKLLGMDTSECETALNEVLEIDFIAFWNFEIYELWLKDADITDDEKSFIIDKAKPLKERRWWEKVK